MNSRKLKIIKDIEKSVPQEWYDSLMKEEYVAPDLRQSVIAELAAEEEELLKVEGDWEKHKLLKKYYHRLRNVFESGYYDTKEKVVDEEIAKKIEDHVAAGIDAAIKAGHLSDSDKEFKKVTKKLKRHVRKSTKSSVRTE